MSLDDFSFIDTNGDGFGNFGATDLSGEGILDAYASDTDSSGGVLASLITDNDENADFDYAGFKKP